jgi:glycosyltransferase involved in cell wall biosynthesis
VKKKNDLQNLTKKYNINQKVNFIGHTNDLYSLMKESFCFVSTSLWEDPGFVIIEAVANRANIISSNCKNGPKEILLDGEGGYLYSSNDMSDLLKKFYKFNKDYGLYPKILYKKKLSAMKNIKIYTKFNHYKIFSKILI